MATWQEIVATVNMRRDFDSALKRKMIDVRDRYNGDYVIPLPNVDQEPIMSQHTPLLIGDAIDNTAMAAGSVRPVIHTMAMTNSKESIKKAQLRRTALYSAWDYNKMNLKWRRMYRHLAAYGSTAIVCLPDFVNGRAKIEIRDPLSVYPDETSPEEVRNPTNVAFTWGRSLDWLLRMYPQISSRIPGSLPSHARDALWDVVEWIDGDEIVCGVLGPRSVNLTTIPSLVITASEFELHRWPNRAGMVPAVVPARVTLDRIQGQVSNIVSTVDLMGYMMALDVIAAEKGIFPDMYAIADPNGQGPAILTESGHWEDGRHGTINLTRGVKEVGMLSQTPGQGTMQTLSYLERSARLTSGNPAMNSGEMNSSIRSGQTVSALQGAAIDPRIQELQEVMEYTLEAMNTAVAAIELGYFPQSKIVAFSGSHTDLVQKEYKPADIFKESSYSEVRYPMPGADPARIVVNSAQMVGASIMSRATARVMNPYIDNPEQEEAQITVERLEDAALTTILQQASSGALPMVDIAEIIQQFKTTGDIVAAIRSAQDKAQKRQAAVVPEGAPEAQPGLSLPGAGVEAVQAPNQRVGPPADSQMNLRSLVASIGRGTPQHA